MLSDRLDFTRINLAIAPGLRLSEKLRKFAWRKGDAVHLGFGCHSGLVHDEGHLSLFSLETECWNSVSKTCQNSAGNASFSSCCFSVPVPHKPKLFQQFALTLTLAKNYVRLPWEILAINYAMIYNLVSYIKISEEIMQVAKWGNSLAVRLPANVVAALELKEGDDIEIQVADGRAFSVAKRATIGELLARLRRYRGRLPEGFRFDRLEVQERG